MGPTEPPPARELTGVLGSHGHVHQAGAARHAPGTDGAGATVRLRCLHSPARSRQPFRVEAPTHEILTQTLRRGKTTARISQMNKLSQCEAVSARPGTGAQQAASNTQCLATASRDSRVRVAGDLIEARSLRLLQPHQTLAVSCSDAF